ncbi:hypothetical protein PYW07_002991 [Mythimna separata]|uniref:snRNA-activating protein complex subunit 3 n=1 Tax=Mythimna separata TaxID=271217 RepID=A0AAD7YGC2_MYTSE|nr:hypothetical protein PYW07_002991 [Mythimna separata]
MSAEDSPAAAVESNDEEGSDAVLSGIILIPQENDESEAQGEEETEKKYVIHQVMVEIMESDEEIKPDISLLDKELAPDIPTEETKDVTDEGMIVDEVSAPDGTLEQDKDINAIMELEENYTLDVSSGEKDNGINITMLDADSAPKISLDQAKNVIEITVLDENSAPVISLDQVQKAHDSLVLDKAADIPLEDFEVPMDINNSMELDEEAAPNTISEAVKEIEKSIVSNEVTLTQDNIRQDKNLIAENTGTDVRIDKENEPILAEDTHEPRQLIIEERVMPPVGLKSNVELFTDDTGPQLYKARGALVTAPIITKNLPKVFDYLPIHGKPQDCKNLKEYFSHKIREFVGCGLTDHEFKQLEDYCSPEQLKTGDEIEMETNVPVMGVVDVKILENFDTRNKGEPPDLCILRKNKLRIEKDTKSLFIKKLKYRGVRNLPFTQEVYHHMTLQKPNADTPDVDLEPGKDILYRVRVYRPYVYNQTKDRFTRTRHSVFCCDIMLTGRNKLSDLRDRFVCHNDFDMRVDVSNHPDMLPSAKAKEVFPSGFLFINNVFYVDTREGCVDYSEPIREWARKKELGVFPKRDMCAVRLEELTLKLGYPEVYVHQGNCEHVFLFSEIRLLNPTDPLRLYNYPCSTAIAQNQTVYCTTCAEFSAKWIVVGCNRVPFDPAFFCDTCFRQYLYIDGQKIGEFKAYSYRGNALNVLKPQ